ncbi:MAG TPA: hypothetical protein PLV55_06105 [Anaerohalosphaeraceae bacterium]|nr:hypothetical protein [Anaerohalosphaeraceae bacterium]
MASNDVYYIGTKKRKIGKALRQYIARQKMLDKMLSGQAYSPNADAVLQALKEREKLKAGGFR